MTSFQMAGGGGRSEEAALVRAAKQCNGNGQCRALQLDHDLQDIDFFSRCMPFYAEVGAEGFSHNLKS